jgi:fatty acid desaturase
MSKKNKKSQNAENQALAWKVKEYEKHEHNRDWYIIAGIIAVALLVYAIWTNNYFFALIIIISGFLIVFNDQEEPKELDVALEYNGLRIGNHFC